MAVIQLFQPNLALCPEIRDFIKQNMDCISTEDGRDEKTAEFNLGFASLRRVEIKRLARKYNVLDEEGLRSFESLPGEHMKARAEQWFAEGKFPVANQVDELAALKAEMEEMRALMSGKPAIPVADMEWNELRRVAGEKGVLEHGDTAEILRAKLNG